MTLSSTLAISSQRGSCRTYLMKCSPSPRDETLSCGLPPSDPPSPLILFLDLGSCSIESTLPKYLLVLLLPVGETKTESQKKPQKTLKFCGNSCQTSMFNYWPVLLPEPPLAEVPQPMQPEPNPEPSPEPDPEPMDPDVADPVPEWESSCSCSKMSSRSQDDEFPSLWAPSPGDST